MTRDETYRGGNGAGTSVRSLVEATDIVNMVVFHSFDAARFVPGQIIVANGYPENPNPKI